METKGTRSLADYLTVKSAAELLAGSVSTLRNWDRAGKLKAVWHPVNRYRLYWRRDLEEIVGKVIGTKPRKR